jgi:hypothetical protein
LPRSLQPAGSRPCLQYSATASTRQQDREGSRVEDLPGYPGIEPFNFQQQDCRFRLRTRHSIAKSVLPASMSITAVVALAIIVALAIVVAAAFVITPTVAMAIVVAAALVVTAAAAFAVIV